MKFLVLSDSHGNTRGVSEAVEKYGRNADVIVHCGDGTRGEGMWLKDNCRDKFVICVNGNCDFRGEFRDIEYLEVCGHKIMITHGHLFSVKFGLERISYRASEEGADIVFFGHTHIPTDETIGGVRLINPGSAGKHTPTCAVAEMDDRDNVLVNLIDI